jgi:asparagine synthase (glutamine-hydrolysing)
MCGIAGIIVFRDSPKTAHATELVRRMCVLLKHRGPDDDAFYTEGNANIGMTRLAILDLRKGLYPLSNESRNLRLFYNGEIYNYLELSSELAAKGHVSGSMSDGEVIVHGYEEWGPRCFGRFNGMWAFALWDTSTQELILGRDHFGIKPLYYYIDESLLAFSSEIGALASLPFIKKNLNERSIYNYLVDGRLEQDEETFYDGIHRLMPGHYAVAKPDGSFEKSRYWEMPRVCEEIGGGNMAQASERVRSLFIDSVRIRLRSDVPVGICLSGGLDSSAIASVIATLNRADKKSIGMRLQGFSALFPGDPIDESHFVNVVSQATETDSHAVYPTALEFWRDLSELVRTQGEPVVGASMYACWRVMQLAKGYRVPVLLDGQGGDELFAGYIEYLNFYIRDLLRSGHIIAALKETLKTLDLTSPMIPFLFTYRQTIRRITTRYINAEFSAKFAKNPERLRINPHSSLAQVLWNDLTRQILPSLLRYEDRNSMHFSIETRLPFLDPRLVEYVASLPIDLKIGDGWTKRVFREAMRGILPEEIRCRRSKIGFETPQRKWFIGELGDKLEALLSDQMIASEFVNAQAVLELLQNARRKKKISKLDAEFIWRCINLELWLREFIQQDRDAASINLVEAPQEELLE